MVIGMDVFSICVVSVVAIVFLGLWLDVRSRDRAEKARSEQDEKLNAVKKTLDGTLVRVMRLEEAMKHGQNEEVDHEAENKEASVKPVTAESVRIALRYNGYSPEIIDTHLGEWQFVKFKIEDTLFRFDTSRLPLLNLELGYSLNPDKEDVALMRSAAAEVTSNIFIGKTAILGDGQAVLFSAEFLCDSYLYLRDNLKTFLEIVIETQNRFYEVYERMKDEKRKVKDDLFSKALPDTTEGNNENKLLS